MIQCRHKSLPLVDDRPNAVRRSRKAAKAAQDRIADLRYRTRKNSSLQDGILLTNPDTSIGEFSIGMLSMAVSDLVAIATLWPEMNCIARLLPRQNSTRAITSALDATLRQPPCFADIASLAGVGVQQEGESADVFTHFVRRRA